MIIADYASALGELSNWYFEGRLNVAEYRAQRRAVLDEMDAALNGRKPADTVADPGSDAVQEAQPAPETSDGVPESVDGNPEQVGDDFDG